MNKEQSFFLNSKPARALVELKEKDSVESARVLSGLVDTTKSHALKMVGTMEDLGYVRRKKDGRSKTIIITDRGRRVAESAEEFMDTLESDEVSESQESIISSRSFGE